MGIKLTAFTDEQIAEMAPGGRMDVGGLWKCQVYYNPVGGEGRLVATHFGDRETITALEKSTAALVRDFVAAGVLAGGVTMATPREWELIPPPGSARGSDVLPPPFGYGLQFPTAEEIAAEAERRGLAVGGAR